MLAVEAAARDEVVKDVVNENPVDAGADVDVPRGSPVVAEVVATPPKLKPGAGAAEDGAVMVNPPAAGAGVVAAELAAGVPPRDSPVEAVEAGAAELKEKPVLGAAEVAVDVVTEPNERPSDGVEPKPKEGAGVDVGAPKLGAAP